jgi:hypothetical protein
MMAGFLRMRQLLVTRLIVAALYAVCIVAPHAAVALNKSAAHCLTDSQAAHVHQHGDSAPAHVHADGAVHHHAEIAPDQASPGNHSPEGMCCGLFCLTGLVAPASALSASAPILAGPIVAGPDYALSGRSPDRITKPPIA